MVGIPHDLSHCKFDVVVSINGMSHLVLGVVQCPAQQGLSGPEIRKTPTDSIFNRIIKIYKNVISEGDSIVHLHGS